MTPHIENVQQEEYAHLVNSIGRLLNEGRNRAYTAVNSILVRTYWEIGKYIVEYEQKNEKDAGYGSKLFDTLAKDLKSQYGKGFSRSNIIYMRLFFLRYPKSQTVSDQLSWSHYVELLSIENHLERTFYEKMCFNEQWSVRELNRQIESAFFHRIALSKNKKEILELSKKGHVIARANDVIKDPYILEFLQISQGYRYSEKELEQLIIDNLQMFLLELGRGFTFVARQKRISIGNRHYYVDLVLYHRFLKCFVLIDLKTAGVTHSDIGQMNAYLNYFKKEESGEDDSPPIGIILSTDKNDVLVEYALGGMSTRLFVSKYKTHLPDKEELEAELRRLLK